MKKITKAVIPVAGYGSRFLPYTKAIPKPMLPIVNRPAIEIIAQEVVDSGITDILFIVGQHREIIEEHFSKHEVLENMLKRKGDEKTLQAVSHSDTMANFHYVLQEKQNGTASAIALAKDFVGNEPFVVLFGDDVMYNKVPVTKQLLDAYNSTGKTILGCKKVDYKDVPKYATVAFSEQNGKLYKIEKIIEKPEPSQIVSNLAPLGRYVCSNGIFDIIKDLPQSKNGEYQFTDALDIEAKTNGAYAYEFDGKRYDMGNRLGFLKANIEFALRDEDMCEDVKKYLSSLSK